MDHTCPVVFKIKNHPKDINSTGQIVEFVNDKNVIKLMDEVKELNIVWVLENIAVIKFVPKFQNHLHWIVISVKDNEIEQNDQVIF